MSLNLNAYKAVTFDFDGTLADSRATHDKARLLAFQDLAAQTDDARLINIPKRLYDEAHRHGSNPTAIIGWLLEAAGIVSSQTDPLIAHLVDLKQLKYVELCQKGLQAIPLAVETVRFTESKLPGRVGITTTAYLESEILPFIRHYKLDSELPISNLVTHDDVGPNHLKPDPLAYTLTIQRFGLTTTPAECLAFEDTPGGVASAKAAGATAVAMCTTHEAHSFRVDNPIFRPDYVFANFAEVLAQIQ